MRIEGPNCGVFDKRSRILPSSRSGVLIVDDEKLIRWSLRERLSRSGYRVLEAVDGRAALDQLASGVERVDLILLDLKLPDTDGLAVLEQAKHLAPNCAVIMMSAYSTEQHERDALLRGAAHFVQKPFKVEQMLELVRRTLESRS